jgi:hypothetical protein
LVGERNADLWVPCPSPHWENHWPPGVIRIEINCWAELSPTIPSSRTSIVSRAIGSSSWGGKRRDEWAVR